MRQIPLVEQIYDAQSKLSRFVIFMFEITIGDIVVSRLKLTLCTPSPFLPLNATTPRYFFLGASEDLTCVLLRKYVNINIVCDTVQAKFDN